jgi:hypothetical protein
MSNRDNLGRFTNGNQVAALGWAGLVTKRFAGNEQIAKRWWGRMGAYNSDAVYRARGLGAMPHPGQPEAFVRQYRAALEFSLNDVPELES